MSTSFSKTNVVDELAACLAARRSTAAQRSGAYRRLALAILYPAAFTSAGEFVRHGTSQPLGTAA